MDDPALDERGRFSSEYAGTKENPNPSYRGRYFKPAVFDAIGAHSSVPSYPLDGIVRCP
jgi:hypothetical protein